MDLRHDRQQLRTRRLKRHVGAAALVAASVICLAGCSGSSEPEPASSVSELRKKFPKQIDLARARATCLEKKGWPVTLDDQGAIRIQLSVGEEAQYNSDDLACLKSLGADPEAPTPERIVAWQYEVFVKSARCLRKAGWQVSDAPSLQTFKDTYESDPWIPWNDVPASDVRKSFQLCPPPEPGY